MQMTADDNPRTLRFKVRGGFRYVIHTELATGAYAVSETSISAPAPGWDIPMGTAKCSKAEGSIWWCPLRIGSPVAIGIVDFLAHSRRAMGRGKSGAATRAATAFSANPKRR
jgi:hypothetical protein